MGTAKEQIFEVEDGAVTGWKVQFTKKRINIFNFLTTEFQDI